MKRKHIVAGVALVVAAAAIFVIVRPRTPTPKSHDPTAHGAGIDWAMSPLAALMDAPEGATPCDTLYNAIQMAQSDATRKGRSALFDWVAPHDEFFARCNAIPPEAQPCLLPRYWRDHRDDCRRLRPPQSTLDQLYRTAHQDASVEPAPTPP
jgi:hypothetical protein